MRETASVVIVGGGVVGASIAWHLTRAGVRDVRVLERGRPGEGSTGRAMGGVRAQFASAAHIAMSLYSIDVFARFRELTGHPSGYLPHGYLLLATRSEHLERLRDTRELQRGHGLTDVEILSPDHLAGWLPFLRHDDVLGGAFRQGDGFVDPLALLAGFSAAAAREGAVFRPGTRVTGIEVRGGRVVGVATPSGSISTPIVVNAAGAWSAEVAALAGSEIPVRPLRRQIARTGPIPDLPSGLPMVIDLTDGFHFRPDPRPEGAPGLRVAGPDPHESWGFDAHPEPTFAGAALRWLRMRAPALPGVALDPARCTAGLYAVTPDHHAILGEDPGVRGFFHACGFSGHGVMHSPATGVILADLVTRGGCDAFPDADAFSPARFASGRLLAEPAVF